MIDSNDEGREATITDGRGNRRFIMKRALTLLAIGIFVTAHGLLGGGVAAAAGTMTVTLHVRQCPAGQPTTDLFTDCHPYPGPRGDKFAIDNGSGKRINSQGNVTFTVSAGGHAVHQTAGIFATEILSERIFCARNSGAAFEESDMWNHDFVVAGESGDTVVCDLYFIPLSSPTGSVDFAQAMTLHTQQGALARTEPSRSGDVVTTFAAGTAVSCDGYVHGQSIDGDDRWLRCAPGYIHVSGVVEDFNG